MIYIARRKPNPHPPPQTPSRQRPTLPLDLGFSWAVAAAVGWGGAWGVWAGPGLVWMSGGVFAAARLWGGRLLAAGHRSPSAVCRCW